MVIVVNATTIVQNKWSFGHSQTMLHATALRPTGFDNVMPPSQLTIRIQHFASDYVTSFNNKFAVAGSCVVESDDSPRDEIADYDDNEQ